jgi:hypothetical protein
MVAGHLDFGDLRGILGCLSVIYIHLPTLDRRACVSAGRAVLSEDILQWLALEIGRMLSADGPILKCLEIAPFTAFRDR